MEVDGCLSCWSELSQRIESASAHIPLAAPASCYDDVVPIPTSATPGEYTVTRANCLNQIEMANLVTIANPYIWPTKTLSVAAGENLTVTQQPWVVGLCF
jgi:hypothetical protein